MSQSDGGEPTIFDKILKKEIPATVVWEDEHALAFKDLNPIAPVHVLLIPKIRNGLTQLSKATDKNKEILGHLMLSVGKVAKACGIDQSGYRILINDGKEGCQSVYHLHLHIVGGCQLNWQPLALQPNQQPKQL